MRHPVGRSIVVVLALLLASAGVSTPAYASSTVGDRALYWNDVLLDAYVAVGGSPGPLARAGAMMHLAMYDAANASRCHSSGGFKPENCIGALYTPGISVKAGVAPNVDAALDHAAYNVLKSTFPALDFTPYLTAARTGEPVDATTTEGKSVGEKAAAAMIARRTGDGSQDTTPYTPSTAPGQWRPTGSGPAADPNWGKVKKFVDYGDYPWTHTKTTAADLRPQPPAGIATMPELLKSPAYTAQFKEVAELGAANSTTRTPEQTQIAWFWANDLNGTYKPPGQLFTHTRIVSTQRGLDQIANVQLFALIAGAMADAGISAWDQKYQTAIDLWRPESAVRLADSDGNPDTVQNSSWQPLSADAAGNHFSPPFPAYVSGHATFAGAWAESMKQFFGTDDISFTGTTEDPHAVGVTRTFANFSAAATENARSRVYLGVHYQWDGDLGVATGRKAAGQILNNSYGPTSYSDKTPVYGSTSVATVGKQWLIKPMGATSVGNFYDGAHASWYYCDDYGAENVYNQLIWNSYGCANGYDGSTHLYYAPR
ncbi:vanadium-dependent haloperoxidase [Streptomyces sp. NPDC015661]|uniref:vanadium-dependent haloperoxidase n=1 Tax=Streptomyces sp. NPDC015661 TaxID=3364961 RepID=UPI0036F8A1FF